METAPDVTDEREAEEVPTRAELRPANALPRSLTPPRVTIVDCDDQMRGQLTSLFRSRGLLVEAFANSADFLKAHDLTSPAPPDHLLLCRLELEQNCGIRLLERLGRAGWSIRTVVYSTRGDIASAVKCFHAGAVDFIEYARPDACFRHRALTHLSHPPACRSPAPHRPSA